MKPELVVGAPDALARVFAERFAAAAAAAIAARGRFSCALPGGSVAERFCPVLVQAPVQWDRVDVFWGDDRLVGPSDPDSNYGLAKRLLLDPLGVDPRRVHRVVGERDEADAVARAYEDELVRTLGDPPHIDLVVLGVGPDGHVCSLFPGHSLLGERVRRVAAVTDSPKPPPRRVTFTLPALALARAICIAGFGASKAEAIRAAMGDADPALPVARAASAGPPILVLADAEAARLTSRGTA